VAQVICCLHELFAGESFWRTRERTRSFLNIGGGGAGAPTTCGSAQVLGEYVRSSCRCLSAGAGVYHNNPCAVVDADGAYLGEIP